MNINHNLTESDLNKIDVRSPLEHQIQKQEMKDSGWRLDKINSMIVYFYKTGELNGSNSFKIPLGSNSILNNEIKDEYCFSWSILADLHPCNNNQPKRYSNYKQDFNEVNIQDLDFSNVFKCKVHRFNESKNLSINIFELNFYQGQNKWRHKLIPIEVSKHESDRVIDLLICKNHYALIKKSNVFLGDHNKNFISGRCLNSYTSEKMLKIHKPKSEKMDITTNRTSSESHFHWKNHFHKNPLYFKIYADFEADNEEDNSNTGDKTTNIYKQNAVITNLL